MDQDEAAQAVSLKIASAATNVKIHSIAYQFTAPGKLTVYVDSTSDLVDLKKVIPPTLSASVKGRQYNFTVDVEVGAKIVPLIGGPEDIPTDFQPLTLPVMGGDPVFVSGQNAWGTIGAMGLSITVEATTRVGRRYACTGTDALLSNNHVLAHLDMLPPGTPISLGAYPGGTPEATAVLGCSFPLNDDLLPMDLALAENITPATVMSWNQRGVGRPNPVFRNANKLERVRKAGARTGATQGTVIGTRLIYAPGRGGAVRQYFGVYEVPGGFSCPGDSGSLVIGSNMDIVGMIAWGEKKPCDQMPTSFFFSLKEQRPFINALLAVEATVAE